LRKNEEQITNDEGVTRALQTYADRGVFRGFRASQAASGRITYHFVWLTRHPIQAVFDSRANTLAFPTLLPHLSKAAAADTAAVVRSITQRETPAHKRTDGRRARITGAIRKGAFAVSVSIRGTNHDYAVKAALNLINEIFVTLQERHPEYLIEHFGMSPE